MRDDIIKRVIDLGEYITETHSTVRDAAAVFGVGKSTVHKDVTERLKEIDIDLYESVRAVLDTNLAQRHLRGGEATKIKYKGSQDIKKD